MKKLFKQTSTYDIVRNKQTFEQEPTAAIEILESLISHLASESNDADYIDMCIKLMQ